MDCNRLLKVGMVFVLFAAMIAPSAAAQIIHVVIIGDTADAKIGKSVEVDIRNLLFTLTTSVPENQLDLHVIQDTDVSEKQILSVIRRVRASAADGMAVFWSGHGGYDENGHFFAMPNGDRLYRSDVVSAVRKCGAGTDVVLSDSCNTFVPIKYVPSAREPAMPERIAPLLKSLFLDARGLVDANGASEGEVGLGDPVHGGTFFGPLCDYLLQNNNSVESWENVLRVVQPKVADAFNELRAKSKDVNVEPPIRATGQTIRVWHQPPGWPNANGQAPKRGLRFGVTVLNNGGDGVVVDQVFPGSPAEKAEVESDDVILEVNGKKIDNTKEMLEAIANSPREMHFTLRGARTGRTWHLKATLR
jgi:hypothetical protein